MNETLQEFVSSRGLALRVDRAGSALRGVKILGLQSRNGRIYQPEALAEAVQLYEGAKVNVNHAKGDPSRPRDYQDRIGAIHNVVLRAGEGLFGDFQFNPKHTLAEQLLWDAEHAPENVGFSHNVEARIRRSGDAAVVEAILRVQSVDLVADPATTRGLFESANDGDNASAENKEPPAEGEKPLVEGEKPLTTGAAPMQLPWSEVTVEGLIEHRPELIDAIRGPQAAELARLRGQLDQLEAAEEVRQKWARLRKLLEEFKLPDPDAADRAAQALVGSGFLEALLAAPSDDAMRQLIQERAELVRSAGAWKGHSDPADSRPQSREQSFDLVGPTGVAAFVEAIT
jgi:hypothetical protein